MLKENATSREQSLVGWKCTAHFLLHGMFWIPAAVRCHFLDQIHACALISGFILQTQRVNPVNLISAHLQLFLHQKCWINPYAAGGWSGQYNIMQFFLKMAYGYLSERNQQELSNEYQHKRVQMVFKDLCVLLLWMKVAPALKGLRWKSKRDKLSFIRRWLWTQCLMHWLNQNHINPWGYFHQLEGSSIHFDILSSAYLYISWVLYGTYWNTLRVCLFRVPT